MAVVTKKININTKGDTDIVDITPQVATSVSNAGVDKGVVSIFVSGSTGGITTVEYEPGLIQDLKKFFEKIAPKSGIYQHNLRWHDGNGYSHVRASFLGPGMTVPFIDRRLQLGTWQQIIFIDFDNRPRTREIL
ncbi:MAG: secondary thiamine-phosphate synthase enzyme YjbQ, partial [Candidatus Omnitrophota bacterium]